MRKFTFAMNTGVFERLFKRKFGRRTLAQSNSISLISGAQDQKLNSRFKNG